LSAHTLGASNEKKRFKNRICQLTQIHLRIEYINHYVYNYVQVPKGREKLGTHKTKYLHEYVVTAEFLKPYC